MYSISLSAFTTPPLFFEVFTDVIVNWKAFLTEILWEPVLYGLSSLNTDFYWSNSFVRSLSFAEHRILIHNRIAIHLYILWIIRWIYGCPFATAFPLLFWGTASLMAMSCLGSGSNLMEFFSRKFLLYFPLPFVYIIRIIYLLYIRIKQNEK